MTIEIYTIRYNKVEMGQIPEQERLLYFMAGQVINEINIYNRLTIAAINQVEGNGPVAHANTAAALTLMKQLGGRVYEAGMILKEEKFSRVLDDYADAMAAEAKEALSSLRDYFESDNLLAKIRNKVAAHVDVKTFRSGYVSLPDDEELIEYLSPQLGNTLHFSAFSISAFALKRVTKQQDIRTAVDDVVREAVRISGMFMTLFNQLMLVFFQRHFPKRLSELRQQTPMTVDAPPLGAASIPAFFFDDVTNQARDD